MLSFKIEISQVQRNNIFAHQTHSFIVPEFASRVIVNEEWYSCSYFKSFVRFEMSFVDVSSIKLSINRGPLAGVSVLVSEFGNDRVSQSHKPLFIYFAADTKGNKQR